MEPEQTRRRIKAARAIAGFDAVENLAEHVEMGATTLRKMERGERPARPRELREIAEACGLPYEFFTVDFALLTDSDRAVRFEKRLAAVEEIIRQDVAPLIGQGPPHTEEPVDAAAPVQRTGTPRARNPAKRAT